MIRVSFLSLVECDNIIILSFAFLACFCFFVFFALAVSVGNSRA